MNENQPTPRPPHEMGDTSVMSVKDWLFMWLIFIIPCVNIVMVFVWAFGSGGNLNRRNYCRAYLIVLAIILALYLVVLLLLFILGMSLGGAMGGW